MTDGLGFFFCFGKSYDVPMHPPTRYMDVTNTFHPPKIISNGSKNVNPWYIFSLYFRVKKILFLMTSLNSFE